jgi:hypothetical protein
MSTPASLTRKVDKRLLAEENEIAVLKVVRQFGHVRRTELARAVWPRSPKSSARIMTQRTVNRMRKTGTLGERPNSLGGLSLILTNKGVARLREYGLDAQEGSELSSIGGPNFFHRTIGTCYLIERSAYGHTALGEYALSRASRPISRVELAERFRKLPDGIVLVPGTERGYDKTVSAADWVEVESSYKPDDEIARILDIAWKTGSWLNSAETVILDRVVFVYNKKHRHEVTILNSLRRYLKEHPIENRDVILSSIVFARCNVDIPLVFRSYEEITALELLRQTGADSQEEE